ncbi:MAG: hypothetical protein ACI4TX_04765 [Christensenellales bacterium]
MENKYEDSFCKKVNQAIIVSEEFAKSLNGKLAYVARVMPVNYKPKGTGKWARVYLSTKTTKELKKLRNAFMRYKLKCEDEVALKVDESEMNVATIEFAIKFKEITREVIAGKINADKEEREDWDELLENIDLIGLQLSDACEYFESLGRYNYGKKRKKKQAFAMQNQVNINNLIQPKQAKKKRAVEVEKVDTFKEVKKEKEKEM